MPDIRLRVGVKRHVGLLALRQRSWNQEDDVFSCSYILLCLAKEGPSVQLGASRKEGHELMSTGTRVRRRKDPD